MHHCFVTIRQIVFLACLVLVSSQYCYAQCDTNEAWPDGQYISDCNGNCFPMLWLFDEICDDYQREWPIGSGILINLSCDEFYCDVFTCEGCAAWCPVGEVPDCNGNCAPLDWLIDDICDVGQRTYNGNQIVFACQEYGCDTQNCPGSCFDSNGGWALTNQGACCLGEECSVMTREDCWQGGFVFMGDNTLCQSGTCTCGEDFIADCDGNCIPLQTAGGGYCSHGEWYDPDGIYDNGDEFWINLDCPELACGLGGCIGNCIGACCVDGGCTIADTFQSCLDVGGIFLGSNTTCDLGACALYQQPIQIPDTELYWSGNLGEVEQFPIWIAIEGDVLVAGAVIPAAEDTNDSPRYGICVYRYDESEDQWTEEALLAVPQGRQVIDWPLYATDGNRIVVASKVDHQTTNERHLLDIFHYEDGSWLLGGTIDEGVPIGDIEYPWPFSIDILGDVLIAGYPSLNQELDEANSGGVYLYHFNDGEWDKEETILPLADGSLGQADHQFGTAVALDDGIAAVMSFEALSIYDISAGESVGLQYIPEVTGHNSPSPYGLDIDDGRIMTTVGDPTGDYSTFGSGIYEYNGSEWVLTAILSPFDYVADDQAGFIVDINGSTALITSPRDDDLGYDTGSAYLWEHDGNSWVFKAKLWSDWADESDEFGRGAALHNSSAYMTGNLEADGDCIKVFSPRDIAWINPSGGSISNLANWDPSMPIIGDTVSFSLRSRTQILVDGELPFSQMFIGPGSYIFDLLGNNRILDSPGEAINIQGVPGFGAELEIRGGELQVNGDMSVGEDELPGKISLVSNDDGVMAQMTIDGSFVQHEGGVSLIELANYSEAPVQITGDIPLLNGVLELNLAEGYIPQDGDLIPLITADNVDDTAGQFSMVLVNDPMPAGLYIKLNYIQGDGSRNTGGSIYAEVDLLENLFGYGDPSGGTVNGEATDIVSADFAGTVRGVDGNDDIAVTTSTSVYIFLSDGNGGIASQVEYVDSNFTSLSAIAAGDFDGNTTQDLVVTNKSNSTFIPLFNELNDIASMSIGSVESTGTAPNDIAAYDTDMDGDDDLCIVCQGSGINDGTLEFYTATPSLAGGFSGAGSLTSPGRPTKVDPGDVNDNKDLILFVSFGAGNTVGKAQGNASVRGTSWSYSAFEQVPIGPSQLASGYLNSDSYEDVVVVCPEANTVSVLRGMPDGDFGSSLELFVGENPTSVEVLDFDGDGDDDIAVVANNDSNNRVVKIYRNDTSTNSNNLMFAEDSTYDENRTPLLVSKGDINGDGIEDLISVNAQSSFRGDSDANLLIRSDTQSTCAPDFDSNGEVNVLDLLTIIGAWDATGPVPEDLDGNGVVNVLDLLILIAAWGPCS